MFDPKCLELAGAFLEDYPSLDTAVNAEKIAQAIQDAIEEAFDELEELAVGPPRGESQT